MDIGKHKGFTLVEIAIVLVVVGLLIGGVLKGRELITNAKIKRVERDLSGVVTAVQAYRDRYLVLPGDDDRASARFEIYTDLVNDPAPADINGDGNGTIDGAWEAAPNTETSNFWKHLRASNLISGGGDNASQPTNAYGGITGVREDSLKIPGHVIILGPIEGQVARILEFQLDDGVPSAGLIQSDLAATLMDGNGVSTAGVEYLDNVYYFMAFDI